MTILPADLIFAGSLAARSLLLLTLVDGVPVGPCSPFSEFEPQAVSASAATDAAATATLRRRFISSSPDRSEALRPTGAPCTSRQFDPGRGQPEKAPSSRDRNIIGTKTN